MFEEEPEATLMQLRNKQMAVGELIHEHQDCWSKPLSKACDLCIELERLVGRSLLEYLIINVATDDADSKDLIALSADRSTFLRNISRFAMNSWRRPKQVQEWPDPQLLQNLKEKLRSEGDSHENAILHVDFWYSEEVETAFIEEVLLRIFRNPAYSADEYQHLISQLVSKDHSNFSFEPISEKKSFRS
jgi:hypothetical protein